MTRQEIESENKNLPRKYLMEKFLDLREEFALLEKKYGELKKDTTCYKIRSS